MKVLVVTDPMCSWCWGMAPAVEVVADRLAGQVSFELLLGGVNLDSTRPVGEYGARLLIHVWREVAATTGARFALRVPEGLIYNSLLPCLAVAVLRRVTGRPPFGYLHRLQQRFFEQGENTNDIDLLARTAVEFGVSADTLRTGVADPALYAEVIDECRTSRSYGTSALPSVLIERAGERSLLAGGYADADTLEGAILARLGDEARG